jgi:WD40 repeat protein
MVFRHRRAVFGFLAALLALAAQNPFPARADYFGRNKVRYRSFHFEVLKTDHFNVYFYPGERQVADQAARMAERWYSRLSRVLDHELSSRQPLILYASHPDFEQTNVIEGELGEGTGGVTEVGKRRIVLPVGATLAETDHVIGHELTHAFQFDIARGGHGGISGAGVAPLPLWFVEGMAEYLSIGPHDPNTAMWMRDAVESNRLPTIAKLNDPRYFPYRYGEALWSYIAGRYGDAAVGRILKAANRGDGAERAIESVTAMKAESLSLAWHGALRSWSAPVLAHASAPEHYGRLIETESHGAGKLNVAPALSPDGRQLVFLSERDLFSVEAYLADAATGRVIRRITRTSTDPHLQSLQFISSSGAFSADGRRFAFAAVTDGRPVLIVIDVASGRTERQIRVDEVGEIFSPTWSPDGKRIAFSAMVGGASDLYIVDVASGASHRLTSDLFADLGPAWSPDGRSIAFATDRFGTQLDDLSFGNVRLALIDPESGAIRPVPGFEDAKNIDPAWSRDGASLVFVSDHGGISNLYRVALESGRITALTDVRTGISGITPLSPAFAVARDADRVVFTAYVHGRFALFSADSLGEVTGATATAPPAPEATPAVSAAPNALDPAELPPETRSGDDLVRLQRDTRTGLPSAGSATSSRYHPGLSLDHVSQLGVGISGGSGGTAVGGGTTLFWSDMLGDHTLATLVQASNSGGSFVNNLAAIAAYENRRSRWDWGIAAGQIPYLDRTLIEDQGTVNGEPATRIQDFRFWQIDREIELSMAYPFSRVQRVELGLGGRRISYQNEVETRIFSDVTGELLSDDTVRGDSLPAIALATSRAALVYDNSVFGGTSPINGQSYRLEVSPVVGDLNFVGALADLRRYVPIRRPLTFAGRVLHFARYGRDGDDPRLGALFIGYPWLVRGYDIESFGDDEAASAAASQAGSVSLFDRLIGTRLAVANAELRLPLLGPLGVIRSPVIPPLEAAVFFDAGSAWTASQQASFLGGPRKPVTSHGVALRLNLFGIAVGELDYVHPDDRPLKGWYWQFGLQPGF